MTKTKTLKVATIIPGPQSHPGSPHLARGTKIILSDGSELTGVTGVTLRADADGLWKASIEVYPSEVPAITAEVTALAAVDLALPVEHPMDRQEFCTAIHRCQDMVLARCGRREMNSKGADDDVM